MILDALRSAAWLTGRRTRAYAIIAAIGALCSGLYVASAYLTQSAGHPGGAPVATDFDTFYAAGRLARTGHPEAVYDGTQLDREERADAYIAGPGYFPFFYPPVFLFLCLPLAWLAYLPALLAFEAAGFVPLVLALRRTLPQRWAWVPLLSAPAFLMNAAKGQNGFFSAACFAGAMLTLDAAPVLGGACLGALVFKPHLAVAVPFALIAAQRWRALAACAATAIALSALAWLTFGTASWAGFAATTSLARDTLETLAADWPKMQSVFAGVRLLHGSLALAYTLQAAAALAALAALVRVARSRPGAGPEAATLVAAAMLLTPYLFDYDFTCLAVPMAWMLAAAVRDGWRPWEKILLLALYMLPLFARALALISGLPLAVPLLVALLVLCGGRAGRAGGTAPSSALAYGRRQGFP